MSKEDLNSLPGVLADIARATSVASALKLAHEFGGTEIYIPQRLTVKSRLVEVIGVADATRLVEAMGSGHLLIPMGPSADGAKKRRRIRALIDQGLSSAAIAKRTNCHERTVRRLRGEAAEERQLDLEEWIERAD